MRGARRRLTRPRARLQPALFREVFGLDVIAGGMAALYRDGCRRLLLADLGRNVYPFYHEARRHGLHLTAVADDLFAAPGRVYRGLPVLSRREALALGADAVVVSNSSAVHARMTAWALQRETALPVHRWHGWPTAEHRAGGAASACGNA